MAWDHRTERVLGKADAPSAGEVKITAKMSVGISDPLDLLLTFRGLPVGEVEGGDQRVATETRSTEISAGTESTRTGVQKAADNIRAGRGNPRASAGPSAQHERRLQVEKKAFFGGKNGFTFSR